LVHEMHVFAMSWQFFCPITMMSQPAFFQVTTTRSLKQGLEE